MNKLKNKNNKNLLYRSLVIKTTQILGTQYLKYLIMIKNK